MKKIIISLVTTLTISFNCLSQGNLVYDQTCIGSLTANHAVQLSMLRLFEDSQKKISEYNEQISIKVIQVEIIRDKLFKSLKDVNGIINSGKDIEMILDICEDIKKYQNRMINDAMEVPEVAITVAKCELQLVNRTLIILEHMDMALTGEDTNLMDKRQRMEVLSTLIDELRLMRGLAYSTSRQVRTVKMESIMKNLDVENFRY